jgi:hypothetical protein
LDITLYSLESGASSEINLYNYKKKIEHVLSYNCYNQPHFKNTYLQSKRQVKWSGEIRDTTEFHVNFNCNYSSSALEFFDHVMFLSNTLAHLSQMLGTLVMTYFSAFLNCPLVFSNRLLFSLVEISSDEHSVR